LYLKVNVFTNICFEYHSLFCSAKRGGLTSTLGPRLVYNREGAQDVKRSLRTIKDIDPRTLRSLEKAVDDSIKSELSDGEDYIILYLDANNL